MPGFNLNSAASENPFSDPDKFLGTKPSVEDKMKDSSFEESSTAGTPSLDVTDNDAAAKKTAFDVSVKDEATDSTQNDLTDKLAKMTLNPDDEASKAKAKAKAKEAGWAEPVPIDYERYNAAPGTATEVAAQSGKGITWGSEGAKYVWLDEYGDIGPSLPALEQELFGDENIMRAGEHIEALNLEVKVEGPEKILPALSFEDAGLHPVMLENVKLCQYKQPTAIQAYVIPAVLEGKDVVATAQTGSGKTAAYLIPILSKLMGKAKRLASRRPDPRDYIRERDRVVAMPLVLVVCPTRELAIQIFAEARRLCYRSMFRPCVVYGGGPKRIQAEELEKGCDILIGTTGRLRDFMSDLSLLSLSRVKFTVLDEADEMLDSDWHEDLTTILRGGDNNDDDDHLYLLFSATFPKEARRIAREWLAEDHVRIRVGRIGSTHTNIEQDIIWTDDSAKRGALLDLLLSERPCRTLIFCNSKREVDLVDDFLFNHGLPTTSMHSDRSQLEREDAIRAFRTGKSPILVTTGVTARGLDIRHVAHIINYDLPSHEHGGIQEYVHRIGRTARIGNTGKATSFVNDRNEDIADDLVKILVESGQEVPNFWASRIPEDKNIVWDDDSDAEDETGEDTNEETPEDKAAHNEVHSEFTGGEEAFKPVEEEAPGATEAPKDEDGSGSEDGGW